MDSQEMKIDEVCEPRWLSYIKLTILIIVAFAVFADGYLNHKIRDFAKQAQMVAASNEVTIRKNHEEVKDKIAELDRIQQQLEKELDKAKKYNKKLHKEMKAAQAAQESLHELENSETGGDGGERKTDADTDGGRR